jgi:diguanylate cyclase (GGDEF)-like protein/PAS domain S-box-containing protein
LDRLRTGGFETTKATRWLLLGVGYFLVASASIWISRFGNGIAGIWFANVFAFAILLRNPDIKSPAAYGAIFLGSLFANHYGGSTPGLSLLFSVVNVFFTWLSLRLAAGRLPADDHSAIGVGDLAAILGLVGGLSASISSVAFAVPAGIFFEWPPLATAWTWFVSNALGYALVLPAMLFVTRRELRELADPVEAIQLVSIAISCSLVACLAVMWGAPSFAIAILPLMLVAPRLQKFRLALVCAVTGCALVLLGMVGLVPGIGNGIDAFRNGFQVAVAVTVLLPVLGGLLVQQISAGRKRISESEERFRRAMEDSPIGVAMVTLDGHLIETNAAFEKALGYCPEELKNKTFFQLMHPEDVPAMADALLAIRSGATRIYKAEQRCLHKDGTPVWTQFSGSVICDQETGQPLHLVFQVEDINERKLAASRLVEAETRWNFALASAGQGVWDLDLIKGRSYYSPDWKKMLGYEDHELGDQTDLWLKLIHPADRERVSDADRRHMENETAFFEAEFRMRHKDGHWVWVLDRGKALERDATGRALRAIGTHTDITRLKETEERLARSAALLADEKERLRVTLESIGDAVICVDPHGRVTFMNPAAANLTRVPADEAQGRDLDEVYVAIDEETGAKLGTGGPRADLNARAVLLRRDGTVCSIRQVVSPILTENSGQAGSVIVFQDFSDARSLQRELTYAASHDALTGLANRAAFLRGMRTLVQEARAEGPHHHFLYIDLDHFKSVNDTSGHAAGDAMLKRVAETISRVLGQRHTLARLGGDEFAVILEPSAPAEAEDQANRIVEAIRTIAFTWKDRTHRIGSSIGISPILPGAGDADEIIARADEACYAAKAAGRGCAVFIVGQPQALLTFDRRSA